MNLLCSPGTHPSGLQVAAMSAHPSPQIFVSYSHHDTGWREHLFADYVKSTLGVTRIWTDAWLRAGEQWEAEIERRL
jgi:hypothetical protein